MRELAWQLARHQAGLGPADSPLSVYDAGTSPRDQAAAWLALASAAAEVREIAEVIVRFAVHGAGRTGAVGYPAIGAALGITRQSARGKYPDAVKAPRPGPRASRVVDAAYESWRLLGDGRYESDLAQQLLKADELEADRGPIRPVVPISDLDAEYLHAVLAAAGTQAVASIAAALHEVLTVLQSEHPEPAHARRRARMALTGEGHGRNESVSLLSLATEGEDISPGRVNDQARKQLVEMILRWVTGPDVYVQVASSLAFEVARHADQHGPDGWKRIADRWLQPGLRSGRMFAVAYRLLYSQSDHFDAARLR
ncbi:hypothetical protein [Amycolatopsis sp. RTGN1]|uniref:hypothetical protein n=1 Tax=Amycolatopsis ponsaeliensis TaxID=2992142 RepID=UPI00254E3093|nr:hypothetical protein [Amycolatopsis sp. RTGN1]